MFGEQATNYESDIVSLSIKDEMIGFRRWTDADVHYIHSIQ